MARRAEKEAEKKSGEVAATSQLERLILVGERIAFAVEHLAGLRGVRIVLPYIVCVANWLLARTASVRARDAGALRPRHVRVRGGYSGPQPRGRYFAAPARHPRRRALRPRRAYSDYGGPKPRGRCVLASAPKGGRGSAGFGSEA